MSQEFEKKMFKIGATSMALNQKGQKNRSQIL